MNRIARLPVLAVVVMAMMVSLTGCDKLKARDQLNKGVESFKAGKYEEAITHFQNAENLDPKLPTAKAFLATALSQNVVPGLTSPTISRRRSRRSIPFSRFWRKILRM